ncbi:MAG: acyltransferase [Microthrixaceae bacterium]
MQFPKIPRAIANHAGLNSLRVQFLHPLLHSAATSVVEFSRSTLRWAYVGSQDQTRFGFAAFGSGSLIEQPFSILLGPQHISIGNDTLIAAGATLAVWPEGDPETAVVSSEPLLQIGSRVWGARGLSIVVHKSVVIGDDVWFGPGVYITDASHDSSNPDSPIGLLMEPAEAVSIGAGSWLGTGVVVLPGVTIGEHVAVGANSVVCSDLPSYCVAVGSPAKVVRHLNSPNRPESMIKSASAESSSP